MHFASAKQRLRPYDGERVIERLHRMNMREGAPWAAQAAPMRTSKYTAAFCISAASFSIGTTLRTDRYANTKAVPAICARREDGWFASAAPRVATGQYQSAGESCAAPTGTG